MSEIIKISNNVLSVEISTLGAEIVSIKTGNFENIWDGNPEFWTGHAPILFPICGRVRDNKYIYNGKEYEMQGHGFARNSEFQLEEKGENFATFLLKANEKTLSVYPFDFEFRAKYTIDQNQLRVEYITTNKDNKTMYFSVGSHEAYSCPEGIEEYSLIFDEAENLQNELLTGPLLNHEHDTFGTTNELMLNYRQFDIDTLIFTKLKTRNITLKNRSTGRKISVSFDGADNLLIWTKDNAKYLCIEPWCGLPDYVDSNYDITNKPGILKLGIGETIKKEHTITF